MNLYGVVTGTNDYSLNVSLPNSFRLSIGDTITIRPLNANTGASTLNIGFGAMPLTLNGAALANGQLEANKDRQCTFIGSGFALDSAAGGGASFVGTSSNLTLGDGSAGIVPAGNFGNLSAADITAAGGVLRATVANSRRAYDFSGSLLTANSTGYSAEFADSDLSDAISWNIQTVSDVAGAASQTWLECKFDGTNYVRVGAVASLAANTPATLVSFVGPSPLGSLRVRHQNGASGQGKNDAFCHKLIDASGAGTGTYATLTTTPLNNGVRFDSADIVLGTVGGGNTCNVWIYSDQACKVWIEEKIGSKYIQANVARQAYTATGTVQATIVTGTNPGFAPIVRICILNDSGVNQTYLIAKISHRPPWA